MGELMDSSIALAQIVPMLIVIVSIAAIVSWAMSGSITIGLIVSVAVTLIVGLQFTKAAEVITNAPTLVFGITTDNHWGYPGWSRDDQVAKLNTAISEWAAAKVDFIAINGDTVTGDVVGRTEVDALDLYADFRSVFDASSSPHYYEIGNHEHIIGYTAAQDVTMWQTGTGMTTTTYSHDVNGVHFVWINADSDHPTTVAQLTWLTNDLAATSLPVILFTHEPLVSINGAAVYAGGAAIEAILVASGKVKACFYGHIHNPDHAVVDGIQHIISPAMYGSTSPSNYRTIVSIYPSGKINVNWRTIAFDI